jgi:hypothetical protein
MAKKNKNQDPQPDPEPAPQAQSGKKGKNPGVGPTGYDYSGWGSTHQLGSRPPAKTDWDAMSEDERAAIGLPKWDDYKRAAQAWRANFKPGGGNYEFQAGIARDIANSGARSWADIERVLASKGIFNRKEEGQALYRRLHGAFQGTMDPTGRFHRTPDGQWVDVGTSDLSKRGLAGRADYHGDAPGGLQAVLGGLAMTGGKSDIQQFQEFVRSGNSSIEGMDPRTGLYFNRTPDGRMVYYDQAGYHVDPNTGQTLGHYIGGLGAGDVTPRAGQAPGGSPGGGAPGGGGSFANYGQPPQGGQPGGARSFSFGGMQGFAPGEPAPGSGFPPPGGNFGPLQFQDDNGPVQGIPAGWAPFGEGEPAPGGMGGRGLESISAIGGMGGGWPGGPADYGDLGTPGMPGGVGSWLDPTLQALLMGQAGLDQAGQAFQLGRASGEYAGSIPLENYLTSMYGDILGTDMATGMPLQGEAANLADRRSFGLLAPEVNRMQGDTDAALERLKQEMPQGGERAQGVANIINTGQGNILGARQALQGQALGGISNLMQMKKGFDPSGFSGAGLGMMGDLTNRRGQDIGMRGQDMDFSLGLRGQDLQQMLGQMGDRTARRGQDLQGYLGNLGDLTTRRGQDFDFSLGTSNQSLQERLAKMQAQSQEKQGRRSFWGSLLGTAGGLLGGLLSDRRAKQSQSVNPFPSVLGGWGTLSDREVKEQIDNYPRGLSDLKRIPMYSFRYKDDAPDGVAGQRHVSAMAQDVQKVAPEAVKEGEDGYLRIQPMALLAMTMNSVKDLDHRLSKLTKILEKK